MAPWLPYALAAAALYGLHQVTTRLAAPRIGEGLGGLVVEAAATLTIIVYLLVQRASGNWNQPSSLAGWAWSALTGLAVGLGTLAFFVLFQRGAPLSAVPAILAGGAALMALAGLVLFREPLSISRLAGIVLALGGMYLLRK